MRLPPTGFLSYARQDDELSGQKLSRLRELIKAELQLQYGRNPVKLFQDVSTIPHGAAWERETLKALGESTFFVPIITPNFIQSEWCSREVSIFLEREQELFELHPSLARESRIFPIHYRRIRDGDAVHPQMLAALRMRQWWDFQDLRDRDPNGEIVSRAVYDFAESICDLLLIEIEGPAPEQALPPHGPSETSRKDSPRNTRTTSGTRLNRQGPGPGTIGTAQSKQRDTAEQAGAPWRRRVVSAVRSDKGLASILLAILVATVGLTAAMVDREPPVGPRSPASTTMAEKPHQNPPPAQKSANSATPPLKNEQAPSARGTIRKGSNDTVSAFVNPSMLSHPTIHLGAFSSQAAAENAWRQLSERFPFLSSLTNRISTATVGGRTLFRLRASGVDAEESCRRLRIAGETCAIVTPEPVIRPAGART